MATSLEYQILDARIMAIVEQYKRDTGKDVVFTAKDDVPSVAPIIRPNADGTYDVIGWTMNIPPLEWYKENRPGITNIEEAQIDSKIHEVGHLIDPSRQTFDDIPGRSEPNYQQRYAENELNAQGFKQGFYDANGVTMPSDIADYNKKYNGGYTPNVGGEQAAKDAMGEGNQWAKEQFKDFGWEPIPNDGSLPWWNALPFPFAPFGQLFDHLQPNWARDFFNLNRTGFANFFRDPLTLDLDGDGIETIGHNGSDGVMFDHDANGIKNPTGWVKSDDGLLVLDRNGDGIINDGSELFGDSTLLANGDKAAHGFAALADLDSNGDGVIDAKDTAFSQLKVWRDLNGDGISQANELFSLNDLGIASLNLEYTNTNIGLTGNNQLAQIGSYTKTDGTTGQMGDVNFNFDPLANQFTDPITLTPEQEKAANVSGMGRLRDLREAAALSVDLANKLAAYSNATTKEAQLALLPDLLEAWARTDTKFNKDYDKIDFAVAEHDPNSSNTGNANIAPITSLPKELQDRWKNLPLLVAILDSFTNMTSEKLAYTSVADAERICNVIENTFAQVISGSYQALVLQTRLKPYVDAISLTIKDGQFSLDFAPVLVEFEKAFIKDPKNTFVDLGEFLASQGNSLTWVGGAALFIQYAEYAQSQNKQSDWLSLLGVDAINKLGFKMGTNANDTLTGSLTSNNILFGGAGNDTIMGRGLFSGGTGNDWINATVVGSDDTFLFNLGDGQDVIVNRGGNDTIIFGKDVTPEMISYRKDGMNLYIIVGDQGDHIVLSNYFDDTKYSNGDVNGQNIYQTANRFEFADGTVWADIRQRVFTQTYSNSNANHTITGSNFDDVIYGGSGNDTITDNVGNNYLDGGAGNDTITGRGTFKGGTGNDWINATVVGSDDTFLFNLGDGQDIIISRGGNDTIIFGKDVTPEMISYRRDGQNLSIIVGDQGDQILLSNYFDDTKYSNGQNIYQTANRFEFADGTVWADIRQRVFTQIYSNSSVDHTITGSNFDDAIYGGSGNDTITDNVGNNYLDGGAGNDTMTGKGTFNGGTGNDRINATVVGSDDTFLFNLGDGQDVIINRGGNDTIIFGKDVTPEMISYRKDGQNLYIIVGTQGDQIALSNYFDDTKYSNGQNIYQTANRFEFADGTVWADIRQRAFNQYFSDANNTITGTPFNNEIYAGSGNDTITTGSGNDIISGGAGNDILNGGAGNDTYLFGSNHGKDTITDSAGNDTIAFTGDQHAENLWFSRQGNNLLIETLGTTDSVTVNSWFSNANYQIETIQLNSGQALINQQVQSLISAMASFAPAAGSSIDVATQKQDYLAQIGISSYWGK